MRGGGSQCSSWFAPAFENHIIDWFLGQNLQDYHGVQAGANIHVPDLAYAEDFVIISSRYGETQCLTEVVNRHASAVGMCINALKTEVVSVLIPGEQRQAVLRDGEPFEDVDKFKYLGSVFVARARVPRRSEAGLILLIPHSLASNPVFCGSMKYCCVQRAGSTRQ